MDSGQAWIHLKTKWTLRNYIKKVIHLGRYGIQRNRNSNAGVDAPSGFAEPAKHT
jgi:hypothetical protein